MCRLAGRIWFTLGSLLCPRHGCPHTLAEPRHPVPLDHPRLLSCSSLLTGFSPAMSHVSECLSALHLFPGPFAVLRIARARCAREVVGWEPPRALSKSVTTQRVAPCVTEEFFCTRIPSGGGPGPSVTWRSVSGLWKLELGAFHSNPLPSGFLLRLRFECCPRAGWGQLVPSQPMAMLTPSWHFPLIFSPQLHYLVTFSGSCYLQPSLPSSFMTHVTDVVVFLATKPKERTFIHPVCPEMALKALFVEIG